MRRLVSAATARDFSRLPSVLPPVVVPQAQCNLSTSSRRLKPETTTEPIASSLQASSTSIMAQTDDFEAVAHTTPTLLPPTQYRPKTHGHHVATLHFSAYSPGPAHENLLFFIDFALRAAYALGIPANQPSAQPTRTSLWTVPKGPFVHKKAQENFERRTSRRSVKVYDANEQVIERWLHLLRIYEMPGVGMRAEIFRLATDSRAGNLRKV